MRITVHSVCGKIPRWVKQGTEDYEKRLPRELKLQWRDVTLARRGSDQTPEQLQQKDGEALLRGVGDRDHCVALDGRGKCWSSERLARELDGWLMQGQPLSVLIGGPDGLSSACLDRAAQCWSLGPMTLPHPLVRIMLIEQLYRAWTISAGHPYHREHRASAS